MIDIVLRLQFCPPLHKYVISLKFRVVLLVTAKVRVPESKRQMEEAVHAKAQTFCVVRHVNVAPEISLAKTK